MASLHVRQNSSAPRGPTFRPRERTPGQKLETDSPAVKACRRAGSRRAKVPSIHGTGLHPSHRQGPPRRPADLVPISSADCATHAAGLDPPAPRSGVGAPSVPNHWSHGLASGDARRCPHATGIPALARSISPLTAVFLKSRPVGPILLGRFCLLLRLSAELARAARAEWNPAAVSDMERMPITPAGLKSLQEELKTLRVTPAMAAGVTDTLRDMDWIVSLIDARAPKPGPRGAYKERISK